MICTPSQETIDSLRLAPYSGHPNIDASFFSGDVGVVGVVSNLPVLVGPQGRAAMIGQIVANADNANAPFHLPGLVFGPPPLTCELEMPTAGNSPNAAMFATRVNDTTQKTLDCKDGLPASPETFVRSVLTQAAGAPSRLVSSCSNAVGDVRIHRVFLLMPGSTNGITVTR